MKSSREENTLTVRNIHISQEQQPMTPHQQSRLESKNRSRSCKSKRRIESKNAKASSLARFPYSGVSLALKQNTLSSSIGEALAPPLFLFFLLSLYQPGKDTVRNALSVSNGVEE
ncbi:hypothetical protein F8388_017606 [Cannabis sativa]|uniref:Uncharacterized protein n=1 Tax=Cannabis sativa TaxID=3483 RepID=A0A7J6DVB9_CANSA|nr:hypothetical protein F8388_017606 [Cannabis sativa]